MTFRLESIVLTSPVDLGVLLEAAFLIEPPAAGVAAVRLLARVNPFVPFEVPRALEAFAAVRTDKALFKY